MTFGQVLKKIRRSKKLKQREIAKKIEMDFSYFSKLENDRFDSKPTPKTIDKIADAMECTEKEKNELLSAADRISEDAEKVARQATQNPVMMKLFRSATNLSPKRLKEYAEEMEAESTKQLPREKKKKSE